MTGAHLDRWTPELTRQFKEHLPSKPSDPLPAGQAVLGDLRKMATRSEQLLKDLGSQTPDLCQKLKVADPSELTAEHLALLKQLEKTLKALKTYCDDHHLMLWESRQRVDDAVRPTTPINNNNGKAEPAPRKIRKRAGHADATPKAAAPA